MHTIFTFELFRLLSLASCDSCFAISGNVLGTESFTACTYFWHLSDHEGRYITILVNSNYYCAPRWLTAQNHAVLYQRDSTALYSAEANFLVGNFGMSLSKPSKGLGHCMTAKMIAKYGRITF